MNYSETNIIAAANYVIYSSDDIKFENMLNRQVQKLSALIFDLLLSKRIILILKYFSFESQTV